MGTSHAGCLPRLSLAQVLDPLYQKFQQWKAATGSLDMDEAIHQTHKQTQELYGVFT